jgi:hypothetical protein
MHRRWPTICVLLVVLAAAAVVVLTRSGRGAAPAGVVDNADATALATVTHRNLSSQLQESATLGYAGGYSVVDQSGGTITSLPPVGQVVDQGQVLYRVNGGPVVLLYGSIPAYRSLSEGKSGADVAELNADLDALLGGGPNPTSDLFSSATAHALERLQQRLGTTVNGTLALGQAVFLPGAARVTAVSAVLGGQAQSGTTVLLATSTIRQVSIAMDAAQQAEVAVGDHATITLPDNRTTPGVISSVGTVATTSSSDSSGSDGDSGSSTPTVTVLVRPTDPAATGRWDQAPVTVTIATGTVRDALVVPVDALLALASGGYAVEVVEGDGSHRLVSVSPGLFDDANGVVQVTGSALAAGQRVVVPGP